MRRSPGCATRTAASGAGSAVTDPRVDDDIEEIDDEVGQDEEGGEDEDDALHHGVVPREDRVDQEQSHPGPAEHRLRQDGATEERAELEPGDGEDRDEGG